jgi:AbiV family abortive infection protein
MRNLTVDQVIRGCEKLGSNAHSLIEESTTLRKSGSFARAYALAHLASEEAAKISMLFRCGILVIMGNPVNWGETRGTLA